jgi:hypothetical protein
MAPPFLFVLFVARPTEISPPSLVALTVDVIEPNEFLQGYKARI